MSDSAAMIRRGWLGAVAAVAPHVSGMSDLLEMRLEAVRADRRLDEATLLGIVDEAAQMAVDSGSADIAHPLSQLLRRTVYEYLLAVDAASSNESGEESGENLDVGYRPMLGSDEIAVPPPPPGPELAHRGGSALDQEDVPTFRTVEHPPPKVPPDRYVAPRGGFHIANPNDLTAQAPSNSKPGDEPLMARQNSATLSAQWEESSAATSPPGAWPDASPSADRLGWKIRDNPTPGALPVGEFNDGGRGEDPEIDLTAARRDIDERLRRKRCDEVGALLQQLAQDVGGRAIAELALDAGDRCRGLGKRMAATNCYLAASRADPLYEGPLNRLADVCIDDRDLELAVSYLERVARLTRLRGDVRGALRIYRKIVTIAPYRDDVLEILMRAQTTGHLDP